MFFHAFAYLDPKSLLEHEVAANQDLHCLQNQKYIVYILLNLKRENIQHDHF